MKTITLTNGFSALVDNGDYEILSIYKWQVQSRKWGNYAIRVGRKGEPTTVRMHRQIMGLDSTKEVDHINGDGLDNRRSNLRLVTHSQNQMNNRRASGSSRHKGVHWCNRSQRWIVRIVMGGKRKYAGRFRDETEAARHYNELAVKHYGQCARLNIL